MIANSTQQVYAPQDRHSELMKDAFREVFLMLRWSYMGFRFRLAMINYRAKMNERHRDGLRHRTESSSSLPLSNAFFDHSSNMGVSENGAKPGFLSFGTPFDSMSFPDVIQLITQPQK